MAPIFLLTITLLLSQAILAHSAEPTFEDRYLKAFLVLNDAAKLERKGNLRAAYALYATGRRELIALRNEDNQWVEVNPTIERVGEVLTELKNENRRTVSRACRPEAVAGAFGELKKRP